MSDTVISELARGGVLRAGINMANPLLVTGRTPDGGPDGVAPDMARALAERLGVKIELVPFASPGEVADAVGTDGWDIGLIGAEPSRAQTIAFSPAYVEIEATYLVPENSAFRTVEEVDSAGVRIAVSERSAYDLYLRTALKHAELCGAKGIAGAVALFRDEGLDALAGLRPALIEDAKGMPGTRLLDGRFTTVQQAIGTSPQNTAGAAFIAEFVMEARKSGLIAGLIARHGVDGRLQVASGN